MSKENAQKALECNAKIKAAYDHLNANDGIIKGRAWDLLIDELILLYQDYQDYTLDIIEEAAKTN